MNFKNTILLASLSAVLISCGKTTGDSSKSSSKEILAQRFVDPRIFSQGKKLFFKNCASCHGQNAEGDKNWRKLGKDRKFPPPPLNGTGHAWHHSTEVLVDIIKNGTINDGGNMPAWKNKLSDLEIEAVLAYLKSHWPDEIYKTWYDVHVLNNNS